MVKTTALMLTTIALTPFALFSGAWIGGMMAYLAFAVPMKLTGRWDGKIALYDTGVTLANSLLGLVI